MADNLNFLLETLARLEEIEKKIADQGIGDAEKQELRKSIEDLRSVIRKLVN